MYSFHYKQRVCNINIVGGVHSYLKDTQLLYYPSLFDKIHTDQKYQNIIQLH